MPLLPWDRSLLWRRHDLRDHTGIPGTGTGGPAGGNVLVSFAGFSLAASGTLVGPPLDAVELNAGEGEISWNTGTSRFDILVTGLYIATLALAVPLATLPGWIEANINHDGATRQPQSVSTLNPGDAGTGVHLTSQPLALTAGDTISFTARASEALADITGWADVRRIG